MPSGILIISSMFGSISRAVVSFLLLALKSSLIFAPKPWSFY